MLMFSIVETGKYEQIQSLYQIYRQKFLCYHFQDRHFSLKGLLLIYLMISSCYEFSRASLYFAEMLTSAYFPLFLFDHLLQLIFIFGLSVWPDIHSVTFILKQTIV